PPRPEVAWRQIDLVHWRHLAAGGRRQLEGVEGAAGAIAAGVVGVEYALLDDRRRPAAGAIGAEHLPIPGPQDEIARGADRRLAGDLGRYQAAMVGVRLLLPGDAAVLLAEGDDAVVHVADEEVADQHRRTGVAMLGVAVVDRLGPDRPAIEAAAHDHAVGVPDVEILAV